MIFSGSGKDSLIRSNSWSSWIISSRTGKRKLSHSFLSGARTFVCFSCKRDSKESLKISVGHYNYVGERCKYMLSMV